MYFPSDTRNPLEIRFEKKELILCSLIMRPLIVLSLVICLGAAIALAADSNDKDGSELPDTRRRFQLPKSLDFNQFKRMFHKSYSSIVESLVRKKLFIARLIRSIISSIKYKHNKSSYYLKVNEMSDWTKNEIDASSSISRASEDDDSYPNQVNDEPEITTTTQAPRTSEHNMGPDEVFVDFRRDNCMLPVRRQGKCGACYAFAHTALLEHLFCKATGKQVAISEQYVIDCGHIFREDVLLGCNGGDILRVGQFFSKYGIEKRDEYPYVARQNKCPYGDSKEDTNSTQMGHFRINASPIILKIRVKRIEYTLNHRNTPVVIHIGTRGSDFREYGGGVHDMQGFKDEGGDHAVLLIGHGREDGREYWLIRNSHGIHWGEQGYYKLAKSAKCIFHFGTFYGEATWEGIKPTLNQENDHRIAERLQNLKDGLERPADEASGR